MTDDVDGGGPIINPRELVAMLFRRRYWLLVPAILGGLLALAAIWTMKAEYRSSATLLIDSQQIPTALVASPLTNFADERIAKIKQQIMSRANLAALVREYDLHPDSRADLGFDDVLGLMRKSIGVDLVGANASPNDGGTNGGSTIAFTLSFQYADPAIAQAVTRRLTEMFLTEDKRIRTEQATGTAAFLARRADELRRQLSDLEETRRSIEARYIGALPNQVALSAQSEATLQAELARIDAETQGLIQQNGMLAARDRELERAPSAGSEALLRAEERLNQLSATYSDNYPDVVAARTALVRQREALVRDGGRAPGTELVATELAASRSRIETLAGRRAALVAAVSSMDRRTAQAPQAAYELNRLEREYDNIKRQYEELREKQLEAQIAANLQSEDKGERFSVVDEPSLPYEPVGAKPIAILMTGVLGGLGLGLAAALAWEFATGPIHGEASLARIMGSAPLGIVPVLQADAVARHFDWLWRRHRGREGAS